MPSVHRISQKVSRERDLNCDTMAIQYNHLTSFDLTPSYSFLLLKRYLKIRISFFNYERDPVRIVEQTVENGKFI